VNLEHRGACGCEANTGDGAGLLIQMPDVFFRSQALGFELPPVGDYGAGLIFLPNDPAERELVKALFGRIVAEEGQRLLGWRHVPTDDRALGDRARAAEPVFEQVFIGRGNAPAPSSRTAVVRAQATLSASASRAKRTRSRSPIATASTSSASPRRP
jgi:glutamate synthase (ferredoxin)